MAEGAEHCFREVADIPRTVVSALVDKEGGRNNNPACRRAFHIRINAGFCPRARLSWDDLITELEVGSNLVQILLGQLVGSGDQGDMHIPETCRVVEGFHQFRRLPGNGISHQGPVAEYITKTVAEPAAHLGDPVMCESGGGVRVAPILNQGDFRIRRAQYMIVCVVHRAVEPVGRGFGRHKGSRRDFYSTTGISRLFCWNTQNRLAEIHRIRTPDDTEKLPVGPGKLSKRASCSTNLPKGGKQSLDFPGDRSPWTMRREVRGPAPPALHRASPGQPQPAFVVREIKKESGETECLLPVRLLFPIP